MKDESIGDEAYSDARRVGVVVPGLWSPVEEFIVMVGVRRGCGYGSRGLMLATEFNIPKPGDVGARLSTMSASKGGQLVEPYNRLSPL